MNFNMENDVFEKATSVMTNRRMQAVSENQMRIEEINKKIPKSMKSMFNFIIQARKS